jgi:hypothetical protein
MTGREFFDAERGNKEKCKLLQKMDEHVLEAWETESVSAFSPGPVSNEELLYLQVVDPTHIDLTREGLKSMAFDVCSSHGLSTHRIAHATVEDLVKKGTERAEKWNDLFPDKPQRSLWGFVPLKVGDVRKIVCEVASSRGLFVYDTANEDDIPHADVCQGGVKSNNRLQARNVRTSLYLLAKRGLITVGDALRPT